MGAIGQSGRKGLTNAMKIHDTVYSSRNFSSSPLTIDLSNFLGDTFDYEVIIECDNASGDSILDLTLNSDTGTNYRNHEMKGLSSTANASVGNSDTAIELQNFIGTAYPNFLLAKIIGSSSDERLIDITYSADGAILKQNSYWSNTADEIDEITFTSASSVTCNMRIIIYATLKESAQEGWELIGSGSINQNVFTTPYEITGLNGDVDLEYKFTFKGISSSNTQDIWFQLNGDTGFNYDGQELVNDAGSISAFNRAGYNRMLTGAGDSGILADGSFIVKAETGSKRICISEFSNQDTAQAQTQGSWWWDNTVDNLTEFTITASGSMTMTGDWVVYRKRPFMDNPDSLPFELIREIDLSGDQSTGQLISNLTGDSTALYKLVIEGVGSASANDLRIRPNDDSGSNYSQQQLKSLVSSASASATTPTYLQICENCEGSNVFKTETYFYPLSGEERPFLIKSGSDEDLVEFNAGWWTNTADEITSLRIFASSSNALGATTAKLYRMI